LIECKEAVENSKDGDELEVNLKTGEIRNLSTESIFKAVELPRFMLDILAQGGAIAYHKRK
jgi:3-isopropylmalate/(R)-2-methylmalate dehydratase small subunit